MPLCSPWRSSRRPSSSPCRMEGPAEGWLCLHLGRMWGKGSSKAPPFEWPVAGFLFHLIHQPLTVPTNETWSESQGAIPVLTTQQKRGAHVPRAWSMGGPNPPHPVVCGGC